jgi:hypothetical protein
MKSSKKKEKREKKPKVNPELRGFDIEVNSFGEISSTLSIDRINEFLNRHVEDKKLKDRDDIDQNEDKSDDDSKPEEGN